ncbi:MAG: outer membrane beta-barrel protein [Pseudomonadota bacterium]
MKTRALPLLSLLYFAFPQHVLAQAENFAGVAVAAGVAFSNNQIAFATTSSDDEAFSLKDNSQFGVLDFSYSKTISNNWLLGVGFSYDLGDSKEGHWDVIDSGICYCSSAKLSDKKSIYIKPTYALSDKVAVFAKLAHNTATQRLTDPNGQLFSWRSFPFPDSKKEVSGLGYALGASALLSKNMFVSGEFSVASFARVDLGPTVHEGNVSAKSTTLTKWVFSAGYKF